MVIVQIRGGISWILDYQGINVAKKMLKKAHINLKKMYILATKDYDYLEFRLLYAFIFNCLGVIVISTFSFTNKIQKKSGWQEI